MTLQQITASDIAGWDSLQDIARSFEKRGLKPRPKLGDENELVLQLGDDEFVVVVDAKPGATATDYKPENRSRHTNLVATEDFEEFTFLTRVRSWDGQQHGRIKHQKLSFSKSQFTRERGEKNTILQKLNSIEYGSPAPIYDTLYDTQRVVEAFYEEFEALRTDLVQTVTGIPDDRGDAKQRYVQVVLDRMIFLYFIQEKRLLDRNPNYLHEQPGEVVSDGGDHYEEFYEPLFFEYLAEDKQNPDFGILPYLNGGLFAKNPVEEEFEEAKLGGSAEKTNEIFDEILDFLSDWNWNVDERLDVVDPKNLSPAILGHIFEQTVNQKEMGAYYTPEEITGFMARRTIHPYLLDQLNEAVGAEYEEIDDVFGFSEFDAGGTAEAVADGGTVTQQGPAENVQTSHVETLYHEILKETHVLDPAVGSGAFLLAAQEVLMDLYMQCIEYFQLLAADGKSWELASETREELDEIESGKGATSLYAKRTIILENLYGVDIDDGAVEICKLRLWLSMVADIEDEPSEVDTLPNIDFNIRSGNSLLGFSEAEAATGDQRTLNSQPMKEKLTQYGEDVQAYRQMEGTNTEQRKDLDDEYQDLGEKLNQWYAQTQSHDGTPIQIEDRVESVAELATTLGDVPTSTTTLSVRAEAGLTNSALDVLEQIGFTTYTYKARLTEPSPSPTQLERIFDILRESYDSDDEYEVFVERECAGRDFSEEKMDACHWPLEFPVVFGQHGGFDVVVGNPPYNAAVPDVDKKLLSSESNYECQGASDSCEWFYERAFDLVNDRGYVSFVVTKSLSYYSSWSDIRNFILEDTSIESVFNVGLGFVGVDLETIALVHTTDSRREDGEATVHTSRDLRRATANTPEYTGRVAQSTMQKAGTIVLTPSTDVDERIEAVFDECVRFEQFWASRPSRGVYILGDNTKNIVEGETPFVADVPALQRFYLESDGVQYVDLGNLTESNEASARETRVPRLLFKVLRGSRMIVYKDETGRFASTGDIVNAPVNTDGTDHDLSTLFAVLNSPVASYYVHRLVYNESTETARNLDAPYIRQIPIPAISERRAEILTTVVDYTMFANQYAHEISDSSSDSDVAQLFTDLTTVLTLDLYFEFDEIDTDSVWSQLSELPSVDYEGWADEYFSPEEVETSETESRHETVVSAYDTLATDSLRSVVSDVESDSRVERIAAVLDR